MGHRFLALSIITVGLFIFGIQPVSAQRLMERLDRGVVAVKVSNGVFISWRLFGNDPDGIAFNVYRGSTKVNSSPITGATNLTDNAGTASSTYSVRTVINGVEQTGSKEVSVWSSNCLTINLQCPAGGTTPSGENYTYSPNDINVGDLDGDGEYELVVKWDPSNAKDNSQSGYTGNVHLHAYKLNGTCLWKIDLGKNIRAGAHYTQHQVADYDGDGFAEVICKTAPGTKDGTGAFLSKGPAASDNDNADYRNSGGYVLSGPEYLTVFNGRTGAEMATVNYVPARGTVSKAEWGDDYGNRVDRFNSVTAWLDGKLPSAVFQRGYYYRLTCAAWDWRNGQLTQRWFIDSRKTSGYNSMNDQGNHSIMAADVDNDGKDEIIFGSSGLDHDGKLLYANGMGHGDANHIGDMDPSRAGLELWLVREGATAGSNGSYLADAKTGQTIWGHKVSANTDVGRGCAADIDASHVGYEMWSSATDGTYNCKGTRISSNKGSVNFRVYWDGDLQDELLDDNKIDKWNGNGTTRLVTLNGNSCNGTKATPNLSADILGDWREEVILHDGASKLYLYTTTAVTTHRLYTLMHDPTYRAGVSSQQSAYNQPPHLGFFLGNGADKAPKPNMYVVGGTQYTLTTSVASGQGSITPSSGSYEEGASVTVTAKASEGYAFDRWGGDLSGSTNPATITMNSNKTISAYFVVDNRTYYTVSAQAAPGGTLTQNPEGERFPEGSSISFTAVPNEGWKFEGWTGDYTGNQAQYTISSLNANVNLTAVFMPVNPNLYEAEYALITNGVQESTNAGFSGTGYANVDNMVGSSVEFTVYTAGAGQRQTILTFANGTSTARTFSVKVNGVEVISSLSFEPTGAWTTWNQKTIDLTLKAGINTITFTSTGPDGGPNLDKLEFSPAVSTNTVRSMLKPGIRFYGNVLTIVTGSAKSSAQVDIFSLTGKKILSRNVQISNASTSVDLDEVQNGSYLLRVSLDGTMHVQKINLLR